MNPYRIKISAILLPAILLLAVLPGESRSANTNPTITFSTNTNYILPMKRYFQVKVYTASGYTNVRNFNTGTNGGVNNGTNFTRIFFSNDLVEFGASFINPNTISGLGTSNGFNGLRFDPTNGVLYGLPTNNFILSISNGGIRVISSNRIWTATNIISTNADLRNTNLSPTNTTSFTNNTANPAYEFVFQADPRINFTLTNVRVGDTNTLLVTNANGLTNTYRLLSGPGYLTNTNIITNQLVATNAGLILLQVGIDPGASRIWRPVTNNFLVLATNPPATNFGFAFAPTAGLTNATNLTYGSNTVLVLNGTGAAAITFAVNPPGSGQFFPSNGQTWFRAGRGLGTAEIMATRAATATSAISTVTNLVAFSLATSPIVWRGIYSGTNTYTNSNPATTLLVLEADRVPGGEVVFSSTNPNVEISRNTVRLLANGTASIVATASGQNPVLYAPSASTNTLEVSWPPVDPPEFLSTNRQDGTLGRLYRHVFSARGATGYAVANLPPWLSFSASNRTLQGTNSNSPGVFRITLLASNAGGITTNGLVAHFQPLPTNLPFQTNWNFTLNLGLSTNTNGSYLFSTNGTNGPFALSNLPAGIRFLAGSLPGSLLLTNSNNSPFAGLHTNLAVVFSNEALAASTSLSTNRFTLHVRPLGPLPSYAEMTGTQGVAFSNAPNSFRGTDIPGYPILIRSLQLPAGLEVNPSNGTITGTPSEAGIFRPLLTASNATGSTNTNLLIRIQPAVSAGSPLQMALAGLFTNLPGTGSYQVNPLPPGLTLETNSGLLTGIPRAVGAIPLQISFTGPGGVQNTNFTLYLRPPAPVLRLPATTALAQTGKPFLFQAWVTGPGWEWSGCDPFISRTFSPAWTNQMVLGGVTSSLASNSAGRLFPSPEGVTFTNNTNENTLALLWRAELPSSWPWQAILRMRISGTNTNGLVSTFLGAFRAQAAFPANFYETYGEGVLAADPNGVFPGGVYAETNEVTNNFLASVATNEVILRLAYDTNGEALQVFVNTNLATNLQTVLLTRSNVGTSWGITNPISSFRLWIGGGFSNQVVTNGQARLQGFAVMPQGVAFAATGLPPGLTMDPHTGTIFGTPTQVGRFTAQLTATNSSGSGRAFLRFVVQP